MSGLERNGFFEGEMEGSKRYREKTAMAEVMRFQTKNIGWGTIFESTDTRPRSVYTASGIPRKYGVALRMPPFACSQSHQGLPVIVLACG